MNLCLPIQELNSMGLSVSRATWHFCICICCICIFGTNCNVLTICHRLQEQQVAGWRSDVASARLDIMIIIIHNYCCYHHNHHHYHDHHSYHHHRRRLLEIPYDLFCHNSIAIIWGIQCHKKWYKYQSVFSAFFSSNRSSCIDSLLGKIRKTYFFRFWAFLTIY